MQCEVCNTRRDVQRFRDETGEAWPWYYICGACNAERSMTTEEYNKERTQ